jgi:hypothetical protein
VKSLLHVATTKAELYCNSMPTSNSKAHLQQQMMLFTQILFEFMCSAAPLAERVGP